MTKIPENVPIPGILNTRLGRLTFNDGVPADDTTPPGTTSPVVTTSALDAYISAQQLVSLKAMHNGLQSVHEPPATLGP